MFKMGPTQRVIGGAVEILRVRFAWSRVELFALASGSSLLLQGGFGAVRVLESLPN